MKLFFILIALLFLIAPANAQTPSFQMPLDCAIGEDCWVVNHVDVAPSSAAKDFNCGSLTYNDHHGTDFAIKDRLAVETGMNVLAAANGTILRVRDGIDDKIINDETRTKMLAENKGCGNGVFIDHGDGWQTIYCHLKKGSIVAKSNQKIKAGQKIGQVGYSGIAEFPHLHFGVFLEGNTIDPYTGDGDQKGCGVEQNPLWAAKLDLQYEPVSIYAAGFKVGVPDFELVKIDTASPDKVLASSEALTFWVSIFGVVKGDQVDMTVYDPSGRVFAERKMIQDKTRARQFYFIGRKVHDKGLEIGTYTGQIKLIRMTEGDETIERKKTKTLIVE